VLEPLTHLAALLLREQVNVYLHHLYPVFIYIIINRFV
jgi:hypothetical protein